MSHPRSFSPHDAHHVRTAEHVIVDPLDALLTLAPFVIRPARHESFALLLDEQRRGTTIVHQRRALDPDDVFDLAAEATAAADANDRGAILLTSRPHAPSEPTDAERWSVLDDLFHGCGLELVEWFVDGRTLDLPRSRAGVSPRWRPGDEPDQRRTC